MRIFAVLLLIGVLAPTEGPAQKVATGPVPPLVEKVDVAVTNVDVTVLDSHARPVLDLGTDDFEVFEDGVRQPITNFYAVQKSVTSRDAMVSTVPKDVAAGPDDRFRRRVMVLIDYVHTSKFRRDLALSNLEKFIDTRFNGDYDWSVATMNRHIHLILPFTSNRDEIHTTFAEVRQNRRGKELSSVSAQERFLSPDDAPRPAGWPGANRRHDTTEGNAFLDEADALESSLQVQDGTRAILDAIRSLGGLPGKKILMLVTGGTSLDAAVKNFEEEETTAARGRFRGIDNQREEDLARLRDRMVEEANASGVTIYVMNSEGLTVPGFDAGSARSVATTSFGGSTPVWLSLQTGGQYFPGNSIAVSLNQFDERSGNFYSLGYRPSSKPGYHRIAVKIRRPGRYTILARDGYAMIDSEMALERALRSEIGVASHPTSLAMTLSIAAPLLSTHGNRNVPLLATMAMKDLQLIPRNGGDAGRVHMYVSIFDDRGRNVGFHHLYRDISGSDGSDGRYSFSTNIRLPPGQYEVAVALRDDVTDSVGIKVGRVKI
jgi:VWFA-related protein